MGLRPSAEGLTISRDEPCTWVTDVPRFIPAKVAVIRDFSYPRTIPLSFHPGAEKTAVYGV